MITPRSAESESEDENRDIHPMSPESAIADIKFWMDHPSLDDLTAAQTEPDRQQVRRDVEECLLLLKKPSNRLPPTAEGIDSEPTIQNSRYTVVKVLGVGAFGVVLHAIDRSLHRDVAIKILRPSVSLSKDARARFTIEGEALARCNCPGVVPVHEVGSIDGHPYLVMGLVQGMTLADYLKTREEPLSPSIAARLVSEVAQAVHQAHQRGILHRDLKPSNILLQYNVGQFSKLANVRRLTESASTADSSPPEPTTDFPFTPFVSDFGLAKDLLPDSKHNLSHSKNDSPIIGTVRYMSPEQATGRSQDVSVTSDVFSLGVILYELLTLECPFQGETTYEIIQQVVNALPKQPRQLNSKIPRDLNAIVGRCLEKEPTHRYQSARELADDLQRFLAGKPVMAKPAGPIKATWFWAKRNPSLAITSSIIWIGLLASTVAISLLYRYASEARQREESSRRFALRSMDDSLRYTAETILQNVPQSAEKKLDLHLRSLKKHEEYAKLRGHDEESMHRLSIAHHYVANDAYNCQEFDLAAIHRNRCLEILGALADEHPKNREYHFDIFMNRFLTHWGSMSTKEYLDWLVKTREYLVQARQLSSHNPDYEDCDAAICTKIGHLEFDCDKATCREWFTKAIEIAMELAPKYPNKPDYYKHAIGGHHGLARVYSAERKWKLACEHCVQALDLIENHFHKSKDIADIQYLTLETLDYYSKALGQLDQKKAIEVNDRYIAATFEVQKLDSRFKFYQMYRARAYLRQAKLHHQLGDASDCYSTFAKAKETLEGFHPVAESHKVELEDILAGISELEITLSDPM